MRASQRMPMPDPAVPTARLFVAVWPDALARAQLGACRDRWRWFVGAKPVDDAKLHLTLHFIGAFARDRIDALTTALAALPSEHFDLRTGGSELWRGGVAVLRIDSDRRLMALHAAIATVLERFEVILEARPFLPHVTFARKARQAEPPSTRCDLAWRANGFALVESTGGTYRVLRVFSSPA